MTEVSLPDSAWADFPDLVARAERLIGTGQRRLLGIAGAPGAGKSTLAAQLVVALAPNAVLVPMDGFHLAEDELKRLGIHDRKGAIDTFDVGGFVTLLRRLRAAEEPVVYAPVFRRDLEEPIAGAISVSSSTPLVVTEGNYLLVDDGRWAAIRGLLDEAWYVEPDEQSRLDRLVQRHVAFGRDRSTAESRAFGSDQANAELIATTRPRADLVIKTFG
jgi:pantothenate kinase